MDALNSHDMTLVRGEMPSWSDLEVVGGASGPVFEHLVRRHLGDRKHTLVAGPHDWALVDLVVAHSERTTVLLRGHQDALQAAHRYSRDNVAVVCGDVLALSLDEPADALVALDGPDRTVSVETDHATWGQTLAHLLEQLTDEPTVLLTVDNPLSLARLARIPAAEADDADDAWRHVSWTDPTRPRTAEQARLAVPGASIYSVHPAVTAPTLATRFGRVARGSGLEALAVAHNTLADVRLDTRTTMRRAADAGRLDDFASGWLLVSERSDATDLVAVAGNPATGAIESFYDRDGHLVQRVEEAEEVATDAWAVVAAGDCSPVPGGRLLEEVLLEACAARDIGEVRRALTAVADRVRDASTDDLAVLASATFDQVLVTSDGSLIPLNPHLRMRDVPTAEELLLGLFDDFAGRVLSLGWRHPWPVAAGRYEITLLMAATVGIGATRDDVIASRERREHADRSRGRLAGGYLAVQPETVQRLEEQNEALASKVRWFEAAVRQRDKLMAQMRRPQEPQQRPKLAKKLRETEAELTRIKGSRSYRVAQALSRSARAAGRIRRR